MNEYSSIIGVLEERDIIFLADAANNMKSAKVQIWTLKDFKYLT